MRELVARLTPRPVRQAVRLAIRGGRRVGYARARWRRPFGSRPPHYVAVCGIFRDEAAYLSEWVTFHRLQGVERFWLYDNLSTDDWRSELEPELRAGIVEVTPWPVEPGQMSAYADCLRRHRNDARWVAFIDVDEFLFSPRGERLGDVLHGFDTQPAVAVNWRVYGTSGYVEPPSGLVTENYLWRLRDERAMNEHVKSIVYPRRASTTVENPHMFRLYGSAVGEDRRPVNSPFRSALTADLLRINHYWSRSLSELRRKRARSDAGSGQLNRPLAPSFREAVDYRDGLPVPKDEERDETALQFVPALRKALAARRGLIDSAS